MLIRRRVSTAILTATGITTDTVGLASMRFEGAGVSIIHTKNSLNEQFKVSPLYITVDLICCVAIDKNKQQIIIVKGGLEGIHTH